jgi:hypothetical protein
LEIARQDLELCKAFAIDIERSGVGARSLWDLDIVKAKTTARTMVFVMRGFTSWQKRTEDLGDQ